MFLTSKLLTHFIDGFILKTKSQFIVYLLNDNEHIYWILNLEDEMYSIWVTGRRDLQECKDNNVQFYFSKSGGTGRYMGFIRAVKGSPGQMGSSPEPLCQSTGKLSFSMLNLGNGCSTCGVVGIAAETLTHSRRGSSLTGRMPINLGLCLNSTLEADEWE